MDEENWKLIIPDKSISGSFSIKYSKFVLILWFNIDKIKKESN